MKRYIAVVLVLALLAIGSFCMVGGVVSQETENVTIRENIRFGDKSYAEGLTVFTKSHYDDHLFWHTSYTIGEDPHISTDYEFYYAEHYEQEPRIHQGLVLDPGFEYGFNMKIPADECVGLQKAYHELYDETPEGSRGTKMIRLQDYYDYYPVRVFSMDFPGIRWQGHDYEGLAADAYKDERAVWDKFNDFFKIPIPEDLPAFEISITKQGNSVGIGSEGHDNDYYFSVRDTYTESRVFFSICNFIFGDRGTQYLDMSLIPGVYGLYSFTYKAVANADNTHRSTPLYYETGIDVDSLSMVYPLEQHAEVIYLTTDDDESKLYMLTKEYGVTYLTVIEIASMTALQKIEITDAPHFTVYEYDTCLVLLGWESISVIEKQADGLCRLAFTVPRMKEVNDANFQKGVATVMAFDGEKLAIVDRTGDGVYPSLELCGFTVAVYDSTGLVYYGEYENSLSTATSAYDYAFNCLPIEYEVWWED